MKKKNTGLFYVFWSAAIILCILLVVFSIIFASCNAEPEPDTETENPAPVSDGLDPDATEPPGGSAPETAAPDGTQIPTTLAETEDYGQEYIDKIVFIGDSTTNGLAFFGLIPEERVWVPESKTFTLGRQNVDGVVLTDLGETMLVKDAVALKKPEYVVLTMGVNGIKIFGEEDYKREFESLVNDILEASPTTKVILNSIYPIAARYPYQDEINNDKINRANGWIRDVAKTTGTRYLATSTVLTGADGYLPDEYQGGDGIHLNTDGYEIVLDYIRTHGYK